MFKKSKSLLSLFLSLVLVFTMIPSSAFAAEDVTEHIHSEDCSHTEEDLESDVYSISDDTEVVVEDIAAEEEPDDEVYNSGNIGNSDVLWEYDPLSGKLVISGSGGCETFTCAEDQPWAAFRGDITEVWFNNMDALSIDNVAYWFSGCSRLRTAEIPYTTSIIGERSFAGCTNLDALMIYHETEPLTIVDGAFQVDQLTALQVRFIPTSDSTMDTLYSYSWAKDNRAAHFNDIYDRIILATGHCSFCDGTHSYTLDYEQWTSSVHCVRHWCSNCGYDQCGGVLSGNHSYDNSGYCSYCGYYNSNYDYSVCYHTSVRTSWSGCDWYDYCRSCGELVDWGTSHGTYVYGSWEYYNSTRHRRYYSCSDCGEGSYSYGNHSSSTVYAQYSATQHSVGSYCSTCGSYVGSVSYANHSFTYGSWSSYSAAQHRRTKTCSTCGYSTYEYASHALSYGSWTNYTAKQHKRTVSCSCGYSTTEYADHSVTTGTWKSSSATQHNRTNSCSCGYSTTDTENHTFSYSDWITHSATQHKRTKTCSVCGYSTTEYANHSITNGKWESVSDTQHQRKNTCTCGYSTTESIAHELTYGDWTSISATQHRRTKNCSCGYSGVETASHTMIEGAWTVTSETNHQRTNTCSCGHSVEETISHADADSDDYCDSCNYLMTRFSVTVPATLSLTISKTGDVFAATSAKIINNSTGAVCVTGITLKAENGWQIVPYSTNMATQKVDSKLIGFTINGADSVRSGASEALALNNGWTIAKSAALSLAYDAVVSASSDPINEQVLTVVFVVDWAA